MSQRHFVRKFFLLGTASTALLAGCGPEEAAAPEQQLGAETQEIVGGTNANISTYPWQISFQDTTGFHFCGGSILNANWILTAQHCVAESAAYATSSPVTVRIAAGSSKLSTMSSSGQIRAVDDIIPFPGYSDATLGKDVALLHLSTPLTLNGNVAAITLATSADEAAGLTNAGITSTVTGWGSLSSGGSSPDTLQTVDVPIVSNADATSAYGQTITADQLAAGVMGVGGKDSCQGDSGGPLVVSKGSGKILAGVVSWGQGCAEPNYPGLYARVSSFQPWISSFLSKSPTTRLSSTSQSASKGAWKHYTVSVPSGTTALNVHISGGTGDADLYVRQGAEPTTSSYTCRPYAGGNNESCSLPSPAAGTWYVSVRGYSAFSGLTVRATTY
ncbi:trypsin-like serine protease [Archangium violaceum]|uniref:trypsin-like serine protease n=1 Tax=Archangium violaceum TaxID=83451 RepID=UPI00193C6343|nr:trypsin-like serine protease [Archangium violaceum]QRK10855.1 trypsin-like serine protease [Archangium violaceum]